MNKKEFREEKQKLKGMAMKDRLWYIWEYYKVPILIALAVLFLLYQAAAAIWRSGNDCMLYCVFLNISTEGEAQAEEMKADFADRIGLKGRETLTFHTSLNLSEDSVRDASMILFESLLGTDTADVVLTAPERMEEFQDQEVFLNLETVLPEDLLEQLSSALYYGTDREGNTVPMGIYLSGSRLTEEYGLDDTAVLGVCTLENHPEVIEEFVRFAFGM